ncbi:hypothetical protein BDQ12DRAFT_738813 [Crucibulum laeve]|uniref:Short-chain dehydrogenase/reductase SDR n=1 Tax=Crucibulum laeve TaxID=68775 RepID=A0A5C3LL53_9AGAR|nr:hypothetical protein BDQ12DRAFT_738813 [Crucibulum laeve]
MAIALAGKIAIVTGASSGIGLATSNALLAAGCSVLGVDIAAPPPISMTNFKFHQINLTTANAPSAIVSACTEAFGGRIDVLVNIAGILDNNSGVDTLKDEDWDRTIAVNLTVPVRLMREVVNVMKVQKSGSIVNLSSKAGTSGAVAGVAYTSSKHGLIGATKNTAWLFKDDGIRCNVICPGAVVTNLAKDVDRSKWDAEANAKMQPVHAVHANLLTGEGVAPPEHTADVIVFLASDLSRGITGAVIPVDNAWSVI